MGGRERGREGGSERARERERETDSERERERAYVQEIEREKERRRKKCDYGGTFQIIISYVIHMRESCHTCEESHVTCARESCHTYELCIHGGAGRGLRTWRQS